MQNDTAKPILLITGVMAAGKSTIAQHLAEQFEPSVHLRGDLFRRMIVNGRADMSEDASKEAMRQLLLRYRAAVNTATLYSRAGFTVVYQDVIIGPVLQQVVDLFDEVVPHVVVLCPAADAVVQREEARAKTGYGDVSVQQLQDALKSTPRIGLWVDSSNQSPEETTEFILDNLDAARLSSSA